MTLTCWVTWTLSAIAVRARLSDLLCVDPSRFGEVELWTSLENNLASLGYQNSVAIEVSHKLGHTHRKGAQFNVVFVLYLLSLFSFFFFLLSFFFLCVCVWPRRGGCSTPSRRFDLFCFVLFFLPMHGMCFFRNIILTTFSCEFVKFCTCCVIHVANFVLLSNLATCYITQETCSTPFFCVFLFCFEPCV